MGDRPGRTAAVNEIVLHAPFAGWLSAIEEVDDPVFATRMLGDGLAIDPVEDMLRAPADAVVVSVAESAHAVTLRLGNGAELLLHIGLDTVTLHGAGFRPAVAAGARVARGDPLIAFDLAAVALGARDMVTPLVVASGGALTADRPGRMVAAGDPIGRIAGIGAADAAVAAGPAETRTIGVSAPHGLHARPAARIVALLRPFAATVTLSLGDRTASAASATAMLALGARHGDPLVAEARGADAAAALDALAALAAERFGDPAGPIPVPPAAPSGRAVTAVPGLAIGRVQHFRPAEIDVPPFGRGVAEESAALAEARAALQARLEARGDGIAEAHLALLADPELIDAAHVAIAGSASAGSAWRTATARAAAALAATGDPRLIERIADLRDLERQLLVLLGGSEGAPPTLRPDAILVAEDLLPSQFLALDRARLAGICTALGGPTAHVAVLAAAAKVPMVVAAGTSVLDLPDGAVAILNADAATLVVDPDEAGLADARQRIATRQTAAAAADRAADEPAVTMDGTRIDVFANLAAVEDAEAAVRAGAEGCGLLRTEFLFLERDTAPTEAEQRDVYARIASALGNRALVVRTLDIGGDKPVAYLPAAAEENPALGQRGIRLSFARPDLMDEQLRAILAAVPGRQCRIMLPMIADITELRAARRALAAAIAATGRTDPVELGVMIETPAAAMLADQLAAEADFLSVGTNDLTQYTLAADRGNAAVANMVDALHPAVLRLIRLAAEGARRHGRSLSICGGIASSPDAAPLLIGLGADRLSCVPAMIPAVKAAIRTAGMADCRRLADAALARVAAADVRALIGQVR